MISNDRGRSHPIEADRTQLCKNLQAVPNTRPQSASDGQEGRTADPDFPGSAAICCHWCRPVTPEAAGSSSVDSGRLRSPFGPASSRQASQ
jgi:hypothetical protein